MLEIKNKSFRLFVFFTMGSTCILYVISPKDEIQKNNREMEWWVVTTPKFSQLY